MSGSAFPSKVTQVDLGTDASPQRFPLGYKATLPATKSSAGGVTNNTGDQEWVYILADEALAIGDVVVVNTDAYTPFHGIQSNGGEQKVNVLGVAQHAIASGSSGFVLCKGYATYVKGDGSIAVGNNIVPDAAGVCDLFVDGEAELVIGFATTVDTASTVALVGHTVPLFQAMINCGI